MILTQHQKDQFWTNGFLVVENAVNDKQLGNLKKTFSDWVEESRNHKDDYGKTKDGRPRFDLQPGHSFDVPGLRRIQSPEEISEVFANVMRNGRSVDMCAELIGQGIRFHHGKVNSKLPGTATKVNFHQDFPFEPKNGPLEVVPGTHKGPLYSHWHNGIFTGSVSDEILASPNHLPSTLTHELVRGEASGRVRCSSYDMQLPEVPKGTSFFAQQASAEK